MAITPLPTPPAVTDDSATFSAKAFAFIAALVQFTTEANALGGGASVPGGGTFTGNILCLNTGLQVKDTGGSQSLILKPNEVLTAQRTLSFICGDANGTLRTLEKTSAFNAYMSASTANSVTGDGTFYSPVMNTEDFDNLSEFNTGTGVFTALVTGKYLFTWQATLANLGAAHTAGTLKLITSGSVLYQGYAINPGAIRDVGNNTTMAMTALIALTAGQTVTPSVMANNSTKTVGVSATAQTGGDRGTRFSGCMVAG